MESKEFFMVLAEDLKQAKLTAGQVRQALLYNVKDSKDKELIEEIVNEKFAQWIPSYMTPNPGTGYDADQESSYQGRVERLSKDEPVVEDVDEDEVAASEEKREELIRLLQETANIADKRGFTRQADFLDDLLLSLSQENPHV